MTATLQKKYTIKELRVANSLSQQELAQKAGVSPQTIQRIEGAHTGQTREDGAQRIARALGLEVEQIDWPRGLTELGRPTGTGKPIRAAATRSAVPCPIHNLVKPTGTGICDYCTSF